MIIIIIKWCDVVGAILVFSEYISVFCRKKKEMRELENSQRCIPRESFKDARDILLIFSNTHIYMYIYIYININDIGFMLFSYPFYTILIFLYSF